MHKNAHIEINDHIGNYWIMLNDSFWNKVPIKLSETNNIYDSTYVEIRREAIQPNEKLIEYMIVQKIKTKTV